jgi:single-strand DNA-binding protein
MNKTRLQHTWREQLRTATNRLCRISPSAPSSKPYTKFSLAVDQGKDQQGNNQTMWLNVSTWDKLAETVETYAYKGMQVFVQGKLQLRSYKDKQGIDRQSVDIVAFNVQLLEKKQSNGGATATDGDPFLPPDDEL